MKTAIRPSSSRFIGPTCILATLLVVVPAWSQTQSESLRGTYVGNEGFLIEGGGSKVLIDGLYQGLRGYVGPTDVQRASLEAGRPPFEGIDLLDVMDTHELTSYRQ